MTSRRNFLMGMLGLGITELFSPSIAEAGNWFFRDAEPYREGDENPKCSNKEPTRDKDYTDTSHIFLEDKNYFYPHKFPHYSPNYTPEEYEKVIKINLSRRHIFPDYVQKEFGTFRRRTRFVSKLNEKQPLNNTDLEFLTQQYSDALTFTRYNKAGVFQVLADFANYYELPEEGIPLYLAHIAREAGYNPYAKSKSGAKGIAQFVPSSADIWIVGGRRNRTNIVYSAEAATRYFKWILEVKSPTRSFDDAVGGYIEGSKYIKGQAYVNRGQFKQHWTDMSAITPVMVEKYKQLNRLRQQKFG